MVKKRKYFGTIKLDKVYRGDKSINLVLSKIEGLNLAKALISTLLEGKSVDLAIYYSKLRKDKRVNMTVTRL
jgi:hypothetical protein